MTAESLPTYGGDTTQGGVMTDQKPIINFHVEVKTDVSPDDLYAELADVNTHLTWAGTQAPYKGFRLLDMDAPAGQATVGTTWKSDGANSGNGSMIFHDRSTVVQAEPGKAFGFDTESILERKSGKTWFCHFEHRYTIRPAEGGSIIVYDGRVFPKNYRPYWLFPAMRPMTRFMVHRAHTKHMQNLARLTADAAAR